MRQAVVVVSSAKPYRQIEAAAWTLIGLGALHVLDHVFGQPERHIDVAVFLSAALGWCGLALTVALAHRGHPFAPFLALLVGLSSAGGFLSSHAVPDFFLFSDSFIGLGVGVHSWVLVGLCVGVSLFLAVLGAVEIHMRWLAEEPQGEQVRSA